MANTRFQVENGLFVSDSSEGANVVIDIPTRLGTSLEVDGATQLDSGLHVTSGTSQLDGTATIGSTFTVQSDALHVNASKNIGIGTTTGLNDKLTITGSANISSELKVHDTFTLDVPGSETTVMTAKWSNGATALSITDDGAGDLSNVYFSGNSYWNGNLHIVEGTLKINEDFIVLGDQIIQGEEIYTANIVAQADDLFLGGGPIDDSTKYPFDANLDKVTVYGYIQANAVGLDIGESSGNRFDLYADQVDIANTFTVKSNAIKVTSTSNRVGIGADPDASIQFKVTGDAEVTTDLTIGSTLGVTGVSTLSNTAVGLPVTNRSTLFVGGGDPGALGASVDDIAVVKTAADVGMSFVVADSNYKSTIDFANTTGVGGTVTSRGKIEVTPGTNTMSFYTGTTEQVRYDDSHVTISGNTGIGVSLGAVPTTKLFVSGNANVSGTFQAQGNITADSDVTVQTDKLTVTTDGVGIGSIPEAGKALKVGGDSSTNLIIPNANNTYNLGATDKVWQNLYANNVNAVTLNGDGNAITNIDPTSHTHSATNRTTSALSGATVFSDLVITDGIVTVVPDTRDMTIQDLGGSYDRTTSALTGATVFDDIVVDKGLVTNTTTRAMTIADLGGSYDRTTSVLPGAEVFSDIVVADGLVTGTNTKTITASDVSALETSSTSTQSGYFGNIYLKDDTNPSHYLAVTVGEDLTTSDKTLTLVTGDSNRTLTFAGDATISGTNSGDQTITLTGPVTGSGTGSFATTLATDAVTTSIIQDEAVTFAKFANAAIQHSTESFVDDDISLMTSAAILDKIDTEKGSLNASNIDAGTIGSAYLPSVNIGTTSVDLTRASAQLTLNDIVLNTGSQIYAQANNDASAFRIPFLLSTADTSGTSAFGRDGSGGFTYNPSTNILNVDTINVSTLDATLASTFANTLGITGAATFSNTVTINGEKLVVEAIENSTGRSPSLGNALKTIWIPAGAMSPTVTDGSAAYEIAETTADRPDIGHLAFDTTTEENAQFSYVFPKSWNLGTITYAVHWTGLAAGAGGVTWGIKAVAVSNDDTIDVAFGTQVDVDDTFIAIEDLHISPTSTALTIGGTPADADQIYFNIARVVGDANDTRAADANLLGITLYVTFDHVDDN
jgi:hypothetical protein